MAGKFDAVFEDLPAGAPEGNRFATAFEDLPEFGPADALNRSLELGGTLADAVAGMQRMDAAMQMAERQRQAAQPFRPNAAGQKFLADSAQTWDTLNANPPRVDPRPFIEQQAWNELSPWERMQMRAVRGMRGVTGTVSSGVKGLAVGTTALPLFSPEATPAELQAWAEENQRRAARTPEQLAQEIEQNPLTRVQRGVEQWTDKNLPQVKPENIRDPLGAVAEGLGSSVAFLPAGIGGAPGVALAGFLSSAGSAYDEAMQQGADARTAEQAWFWNGLGGTSEALPIAHFFDRVNRSTGGRTFKFMRDAILAQGGEEGLQEGGQQVLGNIVARALGYDPNRGIFEGVPESVGAAFGAGALMGGGGVALGQAAGRVAQQVDPNTRPRTRADFLRQQPGQPLDPNRIKLQVGTDERTGQPVYAEPLARPESDPVGFIPEEALQRTLRNIGPLLRTNVDEATALAALAESAQIAVEDIANEIENQSHAGLLPAQRQFVEKFDAERFARYALAQARAQGLYGGGDIAPSTPTGATAEQLMAAEAAATPPAVEQFAADVAKLPDAQVETPPAQPQKPADLPEQLQNLQDAIQGLKDSLTRNQILPTVSADQTTPQVPGLAAPAKEHQAAQGTVGAISTPVESQAKQPAKGGVSGGKEVRQAGQVTAPITPATMAPSRGAVPGAPGSAVPAEGKPAASGGSGGGVSQAGNDIAARRAKRIDLSGRGAREGVTTGAQGGKFTSFLAGKSNGDEPSWDALAKAEAMLSGEAGPSSAGSRSRTPAPADNKPGTGTAAPRKTQTTPTAESSAGVAGEEAVKSVISNAPRTQDLERGSQPSQAIAPSAKSTTRPMSPSANRTGPIAIRKTLAVEALTQKKIYQQSDDYKVNLARAEASRESYDAALQGLADTLAGIRFEPSRVKAMDSLQKKLALRPAQCVPDYLGARLICETPSALMSALRAAADRFTLVQLDDMLAVPKGDGYCGVHLQMELPNGFSVELQVLPAPLREAMKTHHKVYAVWDKKIKAGERLTDAQRAQRDADYAAMIGAYQDARGRFLDGTTWAPDIVLEKGQANVERTGQSGDGGGGAGGTESAVAGATGGGGPTGVGSQGTAGAVQPATGAQPGGQTGGATHGSAGAAVARADGVPEMGGRPAEPGGTAASGGGTGPVASLETGAPSQSLPGEVTRRNLRLTENPAPTGAVARVKANIDAIKVLKALETEKRQPTDAEVAKLAAWSGWGSFKELFAEGKAERRDWDQGWNKRYGRFYDQLRDLLTTDEFNAAAESSVNAHYTSQEVVDFSWRLAERLGFKGGRALESAVGSGVYLGYQPGHLADATQWTAVEMDPITARIAGYLYPQADMRAQPFEETKLPNNLFDLAITNVPFHEVGPGKEYPTLNLHNYFIARMLGKVKPGGLVIAISTKGTMEGNPAQRELLAGKGQLVGAVRLPNDAFKESAATEVVTDILVFRKPDGKPFDAQSWQNRQLDPETGIEVNEYFANHPEMVLGKHSTAGSMYRANEYTVESTGALGPKLAAALEKFPKDIFQKPADEEQIEATQLEDYSLVEKGGQVFESRNFKLELPTWDTSKPALVERAKRFIGLRDQVKAQYKLEDDPQASEADIEKNRKALRQAYKALVKALGGKTITEKARLLNHLRSDPDYYTVLGLERTVIEKDAQDPTKQVEKVVEADVLNKRARFPDVAPTTAADVNDALGISLAYKGALDLAYMGELTRQSVEAVTNDLLQSNQAFLDPDTGRVELAADYLTGDVRDKLAKAIFAAREDARLQRNVEELRKVIPPTQPFGKIRVDLSARWIPASVQNAFAREVIGLEGEPVSFVPKLEQWAVADSERSWRGGYGTEQSERALSYSTQQRRANELLADALNMKRPRITSTTSDDKVVVDEEATTLAQQIVDRIKDDFQKWVRTTNGHVSYRFFDTERGEYRTEDLPIAEVLEREWNRQKNSFVVPVPDGKNLRLPGVSKWLWKKKHLLDGVQTMITQGRKVFAHGVGSGKTPLMIVGSHELKRIGLCKKPGLVVKKATVGQFRDTIEAIYPGSRVLIPDPEDFQKANRRRLVSRIASGDFDFIVLTHEQMKSIRPSERALKEFYNDQIGILRTLLRELDPNADEDAESTRGMRREVANLVRAIKQLKKDLDKHVTAIGRHQDTGLAWDELGIDGMFLDEAHNFKRMPVATQMEGVRGIPTDFSQRAIDVLIKLRDVQRRANGRNVFFFTGTPVSNTLAELWLMIKAVNPKVLEDMGVGTFDSFATTFADAQTNWEYDWKNTFGPVTRMNRFHNPAALTTLTRLGMDVQIGNKELGLDVPAIKGGKPEVVITPPNPAFERWIGLVEDIAARWDKLEPIDRFFNSWVAINTMRAGAAAAVDPRLVFPDAEDHPDSKINTAIRHIYEAWQEGNERRTTTMVLLDMYRGMDVSKLMRFVNGEKRTKDTPKPAAPGVKDLGEATPDGEEVSNDTAAKDEKDYEAGAVGQINLYNEMRDKLVALGVPREEIGIATEANTDKRRDTLFDAVRAGKVRILIGSTEKIGEGVDVATRLGTQIQIDPPMQMNAAKAEQRLGRIIRQGNLHSPANWNIPVTVKLFAQERSADVPIYNSLINKGKMVEQALKGQHLGDEFEDPAGDLTMAMAELVALATGDTRAMDMAKLQEEVRRLTLEEGAYLRKLSDVQNQIASAERDARWDKSIAVKRDAYAAAIEKALAAGDDGMKMLDADGKRVVTGRKPIESSLKGLEERFKRELKPPGAGKVAGDSARVWLRFGDNVWMLIAGSKWGNDKGESWMRYATEIGVSKERPKLTEGGDIDGFYVTSHGGPANVFNALESAAKDTREQAKSARKSAQENTDRAEVFARQLAETRFDKTAELAEKRDQLAILQGALSGKANVSDAAKLRQARREGNLLPVEDVPPGPEFERENVRRAIAAAEAKIEEERQADVEKKVEELQKYRRYLDDEELRYNHDIYRRRVKQLEEEISTSRDTAAERATEETKPYLDRLGELEKQLLDWLNKAIADTSAQTGQVSEGITGGPVWMTRALLNGALRVMRAALQAGRKLAGALRAAVEWIRRERPAVSAAEAEQALRDQVPILGTERRTVSPPDLESLKREFEDATAALRQAIHERVSPVADDPRTRAERQQAAALATARYRQAKDALNEHPGYVEELLLRHDTATDPQELEDLRAMLEATPAGLRNSVYERLVREGRIQSKTALPDSTGRSLRDVLDWMRQHDAGSPRLTWAERLNLVKRASEHWAHVQDAAQRARTKLAAWTQAAWNAYAHPPVDDDPRRAAKEWKLSDEETGRNVHEWVKEINKQVPNPVRQQGIAVWMDAQGDESLLRFQRDAVPEIYLPAWDAALNLTDGEKALARQLMEDFDRKAEDAINAGLMEKARANYGVPQVWDAAPDTDAPDPEGTRRRSAGNPWNTLDPRDAFFSLQRTVPTYFEGIMHGGKPKDLRISHLVAYYDQAFHKALSSKTFIWRARNMHTATGEPMTKLSGSANLLPSSEEHEGRAVAVDSKGWNRSDVTKDGRPYRSVDHWAMKDWKVAFKVNGTTILVRGEMLVHPDHYEWLRNELQSSLLRQGKVGDFLSPVFRSNAFLKASKMAFATFHMMTIGEHMLSHLVNPFLNGFKLDLRDPKQRKLVLHGLELGMSRNRVLYEDGLASHGGLFRAVPGLGERSAKFTDWMFRDYIPAIMMKAGLKTLEANLKRYSKDTWEGKALTEDQIYERTAMQMNAAGGLLNYRQLGRDKTLMDIFSLALLAPQFLEARAKVVGQALKPYGHEQRKMLFVQAATLYVACRLLNAIFDDDNDPHWEEPFSVVIKGRAYSIRTIVGDVWHMLSDPSSFAAGRLSPMTRGSIEAITERDMRTGARVQVPWETDNKLLRKAELMIAQLAKWLLPIGAEGVMPGAQGREQTPLGSALGAVGIGSRKATEQSEVLNWATEFNKTRGGPQGQLYQQRKEDMPLVGSPYRKLNALLLARDYAAARAEYEALLKEGRTLDGIKDHFRVVTQAGTLARPFTGSQARESQFVRTLTDQQKRIYRRAIEERKELALRFAEMLRATGQP